MKRPIFIIAIAFFSSCDACIDYAEREMSRSYEAKVIDKDLDPKDRYSPYIICECGKRIYVDYTVYDSLKTGDYIVKKKGTLKHYIFRDSTSIEVSPVCKDIVLEDRRFIKK